MPSTEFLNGDKFDRETTRVMGIAFEMACAALKFSDQTYAAHEAIAKNIMKLAKDGVHDPDKLCERALNNLLRSLPPRA
jgi:hypothetical protein